MCSAVRRRMFEKGMVWSRGTAGADGFCEPRPVQPRPGLLRARAAAAGGGGCWSGGCGGRTALLRVDEARTSLRVMPALVAGALDLVGVDSVVGDQLANDGREHTLAVGWPRPRPAPDRDRRGRRRPPWAPTSLPAAARARLGAGSPLAAFAAASRLGRAASASAARLGLAAAASSPRAGIVGLGLSRPPPRPRLPGTRPRPTRRRRVGDDGQLGADLDGGALLHEDLGDEAGSGRRDLGVDLVGRDLEEDLVLRDGVAHLLVPAGDGSFGDGLAQLGHDDVGHPCSPLPVSDIAVSPNNSESVGWGWIRRARSSGVASQLTEQIPGAELLRHPGADHVHAEDPSRLSVGKLLGDDFHHPVGLPDDHRPAVAGELVLGDDDLEARLLGRLLGEPGEGDLGVAVDAPGDCRSRAAPGPRRACAARR